MAVGDSGSGVGGGVGGGTASASPDLGADQGALTLAQNIARLQHGDDTAKGWAKYYLDKYGSQIPKPLLQAAGVKTPSGGGILAGFKNALGSALGPVMNVLNRPAQMVEAGLRDVGVSAARAVHAATGFGNEPDTTNSGFGNIIQAATGHGNMTPISMELGGTQTPDLLKNRVLSAGLNLGGAVGLDPLSYVGGVGRAAEAGLGALRGTEEGAQTAEQISRAGFGSLAPEAQQAAREQIAGSSAIRNMAARPGFAARLLTGATPLEGDALDAAQAAKAAEVTQAVEQGGQSGVHFMGRTVLPSATTAPVTGAIGSALGALPGADTVSTAAHWAGRALSNKAADIHDLGVQAAEKIPTLRRAAQAATNRSVVDALTEFKPLAALPDEIKASIRQALEHPESAQAIRASLPEEAQKALDALSASDKADAAALVKAGLARPNSDLEVIKQQAAEEAKTSLGAASAERYTPAREAVQKAQQDAKTADAALADHKNFLTDRTDKGLQITDTQLKKLGALERDSQVAQQALKDAQKSHLSAITNYAKEAQAIPAKAEQAGVEAMNKAAQSETFLKADETHLPHRLTPEGQKLVSGLEKSNPTAYKMIQGDLANLSAGGALKSRTVAGDISDFQKHWADTFDRLGVDTKGAKIVEDDPVALLARQRVEVQRAVSEVHMLSGLAETPGLSGEAILTTDEALAKKLGYEPVPSSYLDTKMYADPQLLPRIKNIQNVLASDTELQQFKNFFNKWDSLWSKYTTSFSMTKRYVGHMFNSFLGEGGDITANVRALRMQQADRAAKQLAGRATGPEWETAFRNALGSSRDADLYIQAVKDGVGSTGYVPQNIGKTLSEGLGGKASLLARPANKLIPLNQALDNNVRLAHYIKAFENSGSYDHAAKSVAQYLFDYTDLTKTEQSVKKYARFYTYLRKNTPLQVMGLIEHPGVYSNVLRAKQTMAQTFPAKGGIPQWALEAGGIPTSAGVVGMDMPLEHAAKAITPALQLASTIPGLKEITPQSWKPEGGLGEVARGLVGNVSGGPISAAKAIVEQATGRSLYSGGPISKSWTTRARQVLNQIIPATSKVNPAFNSRGGNILTELIAKLANVNYSPATSQASGAEFKRQARAVADSIAGAKANGVIIPDTAQLQLLHLVPSAARSIILERLDELATKKPVVTKAQKLQLAKAAAVS